MLFEGEDVTEEAPHLRARRGIARTFQIVQPFAGLTVAENIAVGAYLRHPRRADAVAKAREVGTRVGLGDQLDKPAADLTVPGASAWRWLGRSPPSRGSSSSTRCWRA